MKAADVRTRIRSLFERTPFEPVVLVVETGERVVVDDPAHVEFEAGGVRVWGTGVRGPAVPAGGRDSRVIRSATVAAVVPLEELPGEPGQLSYLGFQTAVRDAVRRVPFAPFAVDLRSGGRVVIERPTLTLAGRYLTYYAHAGRPPVQVRADDVARVTVLPEPPAV